MHIAILTLTFSLPGCGSLKEKRQRMGGLHARFGNTPSVAVCESGERDRHDASEWTFVIVGLSKREVESQCSQIEEKIERTVDARVMNVEREFIWFEWFYPDSEKYLIFRMGGACNAK